MRHSPQSLIDEIIDSPSVAMTEILTKIDNGTSDASTFYTMLSIRLQDAISNRLKDIVESEKRAALSKLTPAGSLKEQSIKRRLAYSWYTSQAALIDASAFPVY